MVTRHRAGIHCPKIRQDGTIHHNPYRRGAFLAVPGSHRIALSEPTRRTSMEEEFDALMRNQTWSLVPRPLGTNIVGSKWIFRTKFRPKGSVDK